MTPSSQFDCFQALADPNRREILMMLTKEKKSINAIADNFNISRPAVLKHVKVLCNTGFITITTRGRERYCELNETGFNDARQWIDYFETYWAAKLKNLDTFLNTQLKNKP
jgi:DNA-binding transcriptional ArsR family regulator